jgi:hypothetical protein
MQTTNIPVLRLSACENEALTDLLGRYGLELVLTPANNSIPGSYWGDEEAGLVGNALMARPDTPVHSILHEACHFVCMDEPRRQALDTDASGDYDEENAVCYLQVILAETLPGVGRQRMFHDMDAWGYSFRLGSSKRWFEEDAEDARNWLIDRGLLSASGSPTFQLRNL